MEIQWSLVLFTALSGAGAWLVACAGLDAFKGLAKKTVVPAVVTGIVLIIVGGIASATHLSHVDRIMAVLAHPAPGIFLEAVLLGIDVVVAVAFLVLYRRGASEGVLKGLGVVAVAMAAIFSYACGSSYMMSSQLAWNTVALPLGYLGTALAAGTALWYLLCAARREEGAALSFAATETLVGAAAALVTSLAYGLLAGIVGGDSAILFWVGVVVCGGVVPAACGVAGMKKTEGELSVANVAVVGAFIGAVAYRVLMWCVHRADVAVWCEHLASLFPPPGLPLPAGRPFPRGCPMDQTNRIALDGAAIQEMREANETRAAFCRFLASLYLYELTDEQIEAFAHIEIAGDGTAIDEGLRAFQEYLRHRHGGTRQELGRRLRARVPRRRQLRPHSGAALRVGVHERGAHPHAGCPRRRGDLLPAGRPRSACRQHDPRRPSRLRAAVRRSPRGPRERGP